MSHKISMHRLTDKGHMRYYKIELIATLFGQFSLEREYGNISFRAPTGRKKNVFDTIEEAKTMFRKIVLQKERRGYKR